MSDNMSQVYYINTRKIFVVFGWHYKNYYWYKIANTIVVSCEVYIIISRESVTNLLLYKPLDYSLYYFIIIMHEQ
jgi:hypothetical protein